MEQGRIEGRWSIASVNDYTEFAGEVKVRIEGRALLVSNGDEWVKSAFTIDVTKDPPWMDIVEAEGTSKAIYRRDGDTLTILISTPGEERPENFRDPRIKNPGTAALLVLLRQQSDEAIGP